MKKSTSLQEDQQVNNTARSTCVYAYVYTHVRVGVFVLVCVRVYAQRA